MVVPLLADKASLDLPNNILANPLFLKPIVADAKTYVPWALSALWAMAGYMS
jgi:hypothetical protein